MEINSGDNKKKKLLLVIIFLVILLALGFLLKFLFAEPEPEWDDDLSQDWITEIPYGGKTYRYNTNLTNILFLGIDNESGIRDDNMPSEAGQSDCIILLTLDSESKKGRILQIPRDTMTEVDIYNVGGNRFKTKTAQIATQYAYCIGGDSSCVATKQTVSELLYELPIESYLTMDYSTIASVNDALGGVTITVPEDYTMIDPAFKKGATLRLTGDQAHRYVRYRDTDVAFSNNERMERQVQYITALVETIQGNAKKSENYYSTLYPLVEKYMLTNLTESQIEKLMEYELDTEQITFLPGEAKQGEIYEEFYVNEEKLKKMLIETFYILKE